MKRARAIDGVLPIICPFTDEGNVSCTCGMGIFNASIDKVRKIMDDDPAVKEGVLGYEAHDCKSFLGDCLP